MADNKNEAEICYVIGVKVDNKERYDKLMNELSTPGHFVGLNFKEIFNGYPEEYPCLVEYYVSESPFGFCYATQMRKVVDAGYLVQIYTKDIKEIY